MVHNPNKGQIVKFPLTFSVQVFRAAWQTQVSILTDAVDDIVMVEDFLAVSEAHVLEDVNRCCLALREGEQEELRAAAATIRARTGRLAAVVEQEVASLQPGLDTERVVEAVGLLQGQVVGGWRERLEEAVSDRGQEEEFIEASRLVYEGVRQVRRAVLVNRGEEETESEDSEEVEEGSVTDQAESLCDSVMDEYPEISGIRNARDAMQQLPEEEKEKILQHVEVFRLEKKAFDREVSKWDDQGNEVILLAKNMCTIMMDMTDFTRGGGSLKTTTDVISAARKISEAGTKLDRLARRIAQQCPQSSTKEDLLAYLQRIALYCHQLNITSKVGLPLQFDLFARMLKPIVP